MVHIITIFSKCFFC